MSNIDNQNDSQEPNVQALQCLDNKCGKFWLQTGNELTCLSCKTDFVEIVSSGPRTYFNGNDVHYRLKIPPRSSLHSGTLNTAGSSNATIRGQSPSSVPNQKCGRSATNNRYLSVDAPSTSQSIMTPQVSITDSVQQLVTSVRLINLHPIITEEPSNNEHKCNSQGICTSNLRSSRVRLKDLNENEKDCPICYENFSNLQFMIRLICNHVFHQKCIDHWLRLKPSCPTCRFNLIENRPDV